MGLRFQMKAEGRMGMFICLSQRAGGRQRTGGDPGQSCARAVPAPSWLGLEEQGHC